MKEQLEFLCGTVTNMMNGSLMKLTMDDGGWKDLYNDHPELLDDHIAQDIAHYFPNGELDLIKQCCEKLWLLGYLKNQNPFFIQYFSHCSLDKKSLKRDMEEQLE